MGQMIIEDVIDSYKYILMGFLISMVVSLIFIAMMRWIAAPMVWLSILGVMALLSYGVYYSYTQYSYFKMYPNFNTDSTTNIYSLVRKWLNQHETWMWILVILSVILAILLLVVIFLRKRIVIAIALIKEGSKYALLNFFKQNQFFTLFFSFFYFSFSQSGQLHNLFSVLPHPAVATASVCDCVCSVCGLVLGGSR